MAKKGFKDLSKKQKKIFYIVVGVLVIIFIGIFSGEDEKEPDKISQTSVEKPTREIKENPERKTESSLNLPELQKEVVLNVEIAASDMGKPIVKGTTNLPDGTEIGVTMRSKLPGYLAGDKTVVKSNQFQTGPFSKEGNKLDVGHYIVDVTMPISAMQPDSVKAIIGKQGEKLKGSLVKKSEFGITVETEKKFFIGSNSKVAAVEETKRLKRKKAEAKKMYNTLNSFLRKGGLLKRLRNSNMVKCGKLMRQYQPQVKQLRERVEQLTNDYFNLKVAATNMSLCVSCSKSLADQFCKQAKESLKHAKKEIR